MLPDDVMEVVSDDVMEEGSVMVPDDVMEEGSIMMGCVFIPFCLNNQKIRSEFVFICFGVV